MTTGGSCSARLTGLRKLLRRTYGGWRIKHLCRITGRWELSSLRGGLREQALDRKEVASEARILFLPRSRPVDWRLRRQCATVGADADSSANLAADTGSEITGVSSSAAEADRVAEWHGGFSSGRPRVADH